METDRYISNEMQFVISCIRMFIQSNNVSHTHSPPLDFSAENLDWNQILEHAYRHRVVSLVRRMLCHFNIVYPHSFLKNLKSLNEKIIKKSLAQTAELRRLAKAFQEHRIDYILLKSMPLAQELYGGIAYRASHDIDLLVHPDDIHRAFSCMLDLGYSSKVDGELLCKKNLMASFRQRSGKDVSFFTKNSKIQVELHWRLTDIYGCFPMLLDDLLRDKRLITVAGVDIPVMQKETMALYLCFLGTMHGWFRLHWLCDVALLFDRNDIDWERVIADSQRLGTLPALGMAVVLVQKIFKTPVPPILAENMALINAGVRLARKTLLRGIFQRYTLNRAHNIQTLIWQLQVQTKTRNRIGILLRLLYPNDRDWEFIKLPNYLSGLYFVIHPFRLVFQAITGTWH